MEKIKNYILVLSLAAVLLAISGCGNENEELTLKEAYKVAEKEALKWDEEAELIQITSTDYEDESANKDSGIDGKRRNWSLLFESPNKESELSMYVMSGECQDIQEVLSPGYEEIPLDSCIDSNEAVKIAIENGLSGGEDWAVGYHISLEYTYLGDTDIPICTYTVRGLNAAGNAQRIVIDPASGETLSILSSEGYDEDGHSIWTSEDEETLYDLTVEEFQEEFEVFRLAKEYLADPDELTSYWMESIHTSKFDPWVGVTIYSQDEWEALMTEKYGDAWKDW